MPRESYNGHAIEELGKIAYNAYKETSKGRSLITGHQLPEWGFLPVVIQEAWLASAGAVGDILVV